MRDICEAVEQAGEVEQSRFAGAGWPHDRNELSRLDVEIEAVEGMGFDVFGTVDFANSLHFDHRILLGVI